MRVVAKNRAYSLMEKQQTHNLSSLGSIPSGPTSINASVTELAYVSDSKPEFCGFDSRLRHQFL